MNVQFKSRKDIFFQLMFASALVLFLVVPFYRFYFGKSIDSPIISIVPVFLGACLLGWMNFGTRYELSSKLFVYRSGPIRGKIEINKIREIIVGKTLWTGLKPATARNGLIIKYNRWDEIYISPESNERFVEEVLKRNSEVIIHRIQG